MRTGRPPKITPAIEKKIAECFFDGLTDEDTALLCGISAKTIQRARRSEICPGIKKLELTRKRFYLEKIRDGTDKTWPRIAWWLERRWPTEFAKPEVMLQINQNMQVTNNSLIISAEVAGEIVSRSKAVKAKVVELFKERRPTNGNGHSPPEAAE